MFFTLCIHDRHCYHQPLNWDSLWTFGTMFITGLLAIIAYLQLTASHKTQKADFAHRLKNDFFTRATSELVMLFDMGLIHFTVTEDDAQESLIDTHIHFKVNVEAVKKLNSKLTDKGKDKEVKNYYADVEIDDLLLGHFEDIGVLLKQNSLDIETVYELFSVYVIATWENEEIQKYINWIRDNIENGSDAYDNFEDVYKRVISYKK